MVQLEGRLKNRIVINQRRYLSFAGTSYLGIHQSKPFQKQLRKSLKKWGACYGSSRKSNLKLSIYDKAEQLIADLVKTETALTVSSGTLAGVFVRNLLDKTTDLFFHLPHTHPSILSKQSIEIKADAPNEQLQGITNKNIVVISDAIASLETKPYSFTFLKTLSQNNHVSLLIDLSHYIGIYNDVSRFNLNHCETIYVSSLGKAYGVGGGFIAGTQHFIESIKQHPLFIGSAGMSPAFLDCFIKSQPLYYKQQAKLQQHCDFVYNALEGLSNIKMTDNYPVIYSKNEGLASYLLDNQILITSFNYATSSVKLNRIVINAAHTKKQLSRLIEQLLLFDVVT